jgi:hypothetical protein
VAPVALLGGLVAASSVGPASASTKAPSVTGSFTDKPYTATTPDSGSCSNNWAIDLFTRSFVVSPKAGTTKVVEHFNNGKFITLGDGETGSQRSPGACDSGANTGHLLREGVSGTFTGSFTIIVNSPFFYHSGQGCGSTEPASGGAATDDGCTTAQWIALAFPGATYGSDANVTAYSLTYKANGQQWIDANTGDSGDIFTAAS